MEPVTGPLLLMLLLLRLDHYTTSTAAAAKNRCDRTTLVMTKTECHSCSISFNVGCPAGYNKKIPGKGNPDCKYRVSPMASLVLSIKGCSHECYKQVDEPRCCPGYWGPDCIECPEDAVRPCSNNGVCSEGMGGNGTCSCKPGFVGTACEDCADNLYGSTCSSACTCVHGLCNAGIHGDGICTCFSGYKGPKCDLELPECSSLLCPQNTRCMQGALDGSLRCQCLPGYQTSGDQCISINPCLQQVCHSHATCAHVGPNKHSCTCAQGYSGDGHVCVPIDPCQTHLGGCSDDTARCVYDGPGKSHCECQDGFDHLAGGVSCSLKDMCRPDSCSKNANCSTVEPNVVECTCHQGYLGNGKICYGNIMQRLNDLNSEPGGQWTGQLSNAITLFGAISWPLSNFGPFTVFVPINKGFKGTPLNTLMADPMKAKYLCKLHMVAGEMPYDTLNRGGIYYTLTGKAGETVTTEDDKQLKIRIHGSRKKGGFLQSDVIASNGIIHILNKLMDSVSPTVESEREENLMKILSDYGKFSKFKDLLMKANVDSVLEEAGPSTIFAPTNTAFDAMKEGQLDYLTSSEGSTKLLELLRNHVVPSTKLEVYNAVSSPRIRTMANQILSFNVTENGQILVNGMAVLEADVEAKNGRLYSLDGVLIPPSIEPVLPHRCDITENTFLKGDCVSCSKVTKSSCPSGVSTNTFTRGCVFRNILGFNIPTFGCALICNRTLTTPLCCKGFYGPDCTPCPGGFNTPCSRRGQCSEGIEGNGTCVCETNFKGSRCHYCSNPNKYGPACDKTCDCIHGVCDNRPEADGRCKVDSCQPGYTGQYCERHTQACGPQVTFCHAYAKCDFNGGAVKCVCKPGFQGDGITCVDTDPCAQPNRGGCDVNAKCIKTGPGSHTCHCLAGWRADEDECQPINDCLGADRGGCHPNATCIYVGPGQSGCACKSGFRGNGRECEANNPCVAQNGGCHYLASCLYVAGAWKCVCEDGYTGDGEVCYGNVGQELMALPDVTEFAKWVTDTGISQLPLMNSQNITLLVPSTAATDKMTKEDKDFWTTQGNLPSIIKNHMIQGVYSLANLRNASSTLQLTSLLKKALPVTITNESTGIGGATITTANVASTNGLIHIIDTVLVPERSLSEGLLELLAQRPEFSLFRSYLVHHNLTEEIEQASAYTVFAPTDSAVLEYLKNTASDTMDLNTTRYHIVLSDRLMRIDLLGGAYKETMLGFSYQLGILPRDDKLFVNEAQVKVSDIQGGKGVIHGLSAVLDITKNRCDIQQFKTFPGSCQDCFYPQDNTCPAGSTPMTLVRKKCMFRRVYEGEQLLSLGCKTICKNTTIVRRCCGGFYGEHCEPCPGPKGQPCYGNGVCQDGTNGTGVCQCKKGFNGTACETCQEGKYGIHCDQDCRCKNGRCNDGIHGDGTCECDAYWRGITCDDKFTREENCGDRKCHTSAMCVVGRCECLAGFQGNGTDCKAKDACKDNNGACSPHAVCKRTLPGRRQCVCNTGYHGDGVVCVQINPCLDGRGGCHVNADCIHTGPNKTSCVCSQGYTGDGKESCTVVNLCRMKHGDCHRYARCNMTGPGERSCTCMDGYVGDGITCKGTVGKELLTRKLRDFYLGLMIADISLKGRGPFTVFAPTAEAFAQGEMAKEFRHSSKREKMAKMLRYHIVSCHTLLASDLTTPRNLTTLMGDVLTITYSEGTILINNMVKVVHSDDPSINGIIHEIDTFMIPESLKKADVIEGPLNLTDVADRNGYKTFYKLLLDTDVMAMVNDPLHQPVTLFLPSDQAMAALPQEQKDFLYNTQNRGHLLEYLKYHILRDTKVYAAELVHMDPIRTLQGSKLKANCGGLDKIGEIFLNDGNCRIIQRHLPFNGGIAYGIDCLLNPPSLGGRCDKLETVDFPLPCAFCTSSTRCPPGSKVKEVKKCDLPMILNMNKGCQAICTLVLWQPKCCPGFYGRDCLVCPGGKSSPCFNHGKCDDGHLGNGNCTCDTGFQGDACELCKEGHYGPDCTACNCTEHGSCEDGLKGTGSCFCEQGWTGQRCETQLAEGPVCSPTCSQNGICKDNNTCICRLFYEGDGISCIVADLCKFWNGGCAKGAKCSQKGEKVSCTCPKGHSGDGFICRPIDPCSVDDNGGCHEHATCTMTGPGKKKCVCKDNYIGDGVTCEVKELLVNRCLQENAQCHSDAQCTDLHYEDSTVGVFHFRSTKGQYKLNYTSAQEACTREGGTIATYTQLSYAQQAGLNLCAASWLDQARVAYPTTYSNPKCGFGHVGIVDYGLRSNLSETWDTFCYRVKEVKCECKAGYIGDGYSCTGNLLQVLTEKPTFSNFLSQILNYSQMSESGKQFMKRLSNLTILSTLFVPDNTGLYQNQTLTHRDMEYHLSEGRALALKDLTNGSRIRTRLGQSLIVLGIADFLNPKALSSSRYINDRFIVDSDILASNGIIHVLQGPLKAPTPRIALHASHKAGMGIGVVLLIMLMAGAGFVGYHFYTHKTKPFQFHYFKDEDETPPDCNPAICNPSIVNPTYDSAPATSEPVSSQLPEEEDKHQVVEGGPYDLLQDC
ncbi:stabilin-2 isoform X2 [Coregonus clupeaformis]|uniref:stabilin-2 isoform X2 n=1 Tax=Coregonus clupeaformis TaxID=59861 RepID=UPI001BE11530|nr:stabilin-2 isoform X2 [Coregonus clupeaformis]